MTHRHLLLVAVAPVLLSAAAFGYAALNVRADESGGDTHAITMPAVQTVPLATAVGTSVTVEAGVSEVPDASVPDTTLFAAGDIMLSRYVGVTMRKKNDVHFPFARTQELSSAADIAFANLETAITEGRPIADNEMTFRADPNTVDGLKDAGFDVLSLANNHTPNFGQVGLKDTFKYLNEAGIAYAGAGIDDATAHTPAVVTRNGLRFAFLAYNDHDVVPSSYAASDKRAGTALMDVAQLKEDVETARSAADVVIVSMHSGHEYQFVPDASQVAFAHAAIDAGADLVLGHHAHVVQPVEAYKGKLLFYGLGNFIFDQSWSRATSEGLALLCTFRGTELSSVEAVPVYIERGGQPRVAAGQQARETLERLGVGLELKDGKYYVPLP